MKRHQASSRQRESWGGRGVCSYLPAWCQTMLGCEHLRGAVRRELDRGGGGNEKENSATSQGLTEDSRVSPPAVSMYMCDLSVLPRAHLRMWLAMDVTNASSVGTTR